jgi:lipopolysaccharide transport system ATP-binding protein
MKISHRILVPGQDQRRALLNSLSIEEGLLHALDVGLPGSARIQQSWLEAGEELLHYEDLLLRDEEILVPLLTRKCSLGVSAETVRKAIASCRFEKLTGGRSRGEEDVTSHERKGVAGDWRNHFTERVKREFKARYGDLLIATGYEKDHAW